MRRQRWFSSDWRWRAVRDVITWAVALAAMVTISPVAVAAGERTPGAAPVGPTVPASCPVTIPNGSVPPFGNLGHFPGPVFHGEHGIWTSFGADGTVAWQPAMGPGGGIYGVKFLWYFAEGVRGPFRVTGTRLDAPAPPLRAETADQAAPDFSPSGLRFPSLGCWRISATAGDHALTFTIWLYEGAPKLLRSDWTSPMPPSYCHVTREASAGANPDASKLAPAQSVSVGNQQIVAFLPDAATFELMPSKSGAAHPYEPVMLGWWLNPGIVFQPLISGEAAVGYGGSPFFDDETGTAQPNGLVTSKLFFHEPGCWRVQLIAGDASATFFVWLWTKDLPPTATPAATPAA